MLDTFRKLRALLSVREQRQALLLLALMLVVGIMELAGVASILPLIAVISEPGVVESNPWLKMAYEGFGFSEINSFFVALSVVVFVIVVGRTALTALSSYAILRFSAMRGYSLGLRLLRNFLGRPYSWFLNQHSTDLSKTILSEVEEVIRSSMMPALQLLSQAITAVFLIGLVVFLDPAVAISAVLVLGLSYGAIYLVVRNLLLRVGRGRVEANQERYRIAHEALSGIKDVKVAGLETAYIKRFEVPSYIFERHRSSLQVLGDTPRYALEAIAIGGMLIVIMALLLRSQGSIAAALPTIAVYGFAGLRLLPVVQGLYRSVVMLRASGVALDKIFAELKVPQGDLSKVAVEPLPVRNGIELRTVSFAYPAADREALRDISLNIPVHSSIGLVGKTGAGKSTLVDLILGLLEPQAGSLLVDGTLIDLTNVRRWQRSIGYVPQSIFLADESIAANIAFGVPAEQIDMAAVERAARMASLHDFVTTELSQGYATMVGERGVRLSGGQRQRVGIARALYHDPEVLVFDEATSALDNQTEKSVMEAVRNLSGRKTIIMIAHRLTTVQDCDRIFVLDKGKITASGPWSEIEAVVATADGR